MKTEWYPHVTVAAVIERDGRFLVVEELAGGDRVLNQPAGHLEDGESLLDAAVRETLEETGHRFTPTALVGIYRWVHPENGLTFLRFCYTGSEAEAVPGAELDPDIIAAHWLQRSEIAARTQRSPLVLQCIDDYLSGTRFPLELVNEGKE